VFLQQQIAEPLFETVDQLEGRPLSQVCHEPESLFRFQVVPMAAHERH
jgi:hypothetical protein